MTLDITLSKAEFLHIKGAERLDPIDVLFRDLAPAQGSVIVRCFDAAWSAYWGNFGEGTTVRQFFERSSIGYLANCLVRGNRGVITRNSIQENEERYLEAIVGAIKQALSDPRSSPAASPI